MSRIHFSMIFCLFFAPTVLGQPTSNSKWQATGTHGAVVAGGEGAVDAGMTMLRAGGNAADAAVATILALTVTDSSQVCFGGEVPILYYNAKTGATEVIAGQGAAPRLATRDYFVKLEQGIPLSGILPASVPALLDACLVLLDRHGTKTFTEVSAPTLVLLSQGKLGWHADLAKTIRLLQEAEDKARSDRRRGIRLVGDEFYRGAIARAIDQWSRENGGLIRYADLAAHVTRVEEPVTVAYRGHTIVKCGVWTQGPALLETLQILEGFDLKSMGHNSTDVIHHQVEALKLGFADRDYYYADPLFVDVPTQALLDPGYATLRRGLIDPTASSTRIRPGDPVQHQALLAEPRIRAGIEGENRDTTTCLVADAYGNVVAATPSGWSGVVAGSTGVWLGSRLQSFNVWENHPNVIEPGKRPRITLTPSLVLKEGSPVLAVSVAGGDNQDQVSLQLISNHVDFGMSAADSVIAPRWLTEHFIGSFGQKPPQVGSLKIYENLHDSVKTELAARGHKVTLGKAPLSAAPTVITFDPKTGGKTAAGDPTAGRHAAAY